jgi:hypothetical protein
VRVWPVLILIAVIAAASAGTWVLGRSRDEQLAAGRDRSAKAVVAAVKDQIEQREKYLAQAVELLTNNTTLRQVVGTDEKTVKDQIEEEGLRSLRSHDVFLIGRILEQGGTHFEILAVKGLPGLTADQLQQHPAVQAVLRASSPNPVAGVLTEGDSAALFAVAPFSSLDDTVRGLVLIGEPLGVEFLDRITNQTRATLVLSDGHRSLAHVGEAELVRLLEGVIGQEAEFKDKSFTDPGWRVAARTVPVSAHASLWVGSSMSSEVQLIDSSFSLKATVLWIGMLGLGVALALVVRRRMRPAPLNPPAPAPTPLESWAGTTSGRTGASSFTAPGTVVPVILPDGQVGQLITGAAIPTRSSPGIATSLAGMTAPHIAADPNVFGRYRLLERLGSGGMAEVWTAVATGAEGFRRPFVVKRIRRDIASNTDLVQAFIDEANLAAQLVHSNIVPVFDFGNLNGEYYIAQEYILGRDLGRITSALAQRGQRLPPDLALYVCAETLKALDYAHTLTDNAGNPLGIVHRDISPNNILCSKRGEVKLIDFGIAKSVSKVGQTEVGTVKGNLRFMSPEQAQGLPVDARSDLFSLAMSMYFTQRGESLYTASNPYELLLAAARGPESQDLQKLDEMAAELRDLLVPALSPQRESRYMTAQHFLEYVLPQAPADGARRLAALIHELFGEDLRLQETQFSTAAGASDVINGEATVQSIPMRAR